MQIIFCDYRKNPFWRLGSSLGIDLLSQEEKICNFDYVYCQLGPAKKHTVERKIYVPVEKVIKELGALPDTHIDFVTFSGRGELTLAANLGEAIKAIKLIRKETIAVLTNGSFCKAIKIISVYDERAFKDVASISDEDTLKRRGKVK